jgi:hypothetical protein
MDDSDVQVSNEMANRMSLFYAYPTPMLKTLSDATSKFVSEVSKIPHNKRKQVGKLMQLLQQLMGKYLY